MSASYGGVVVLQADSGYDAALYTALSVAPVLLLDGRPKGTSEHAGFAQLAAAGKALCCITLFHDMYILLMVSLVHTFAVALLTTAGCNYPVLW
jgi:hypothetical protein